MHAMFEARRIRTRTPEWRTIYDRIHAAMELTSRLNVLPFSDIDARDALLRELLGGPLPDKAVIYPPFYSTYGLATELGGRGVRGPGLFIPRPRRNHDRGPIDDLSEGHPDH